MVSNSRTHLEHFCCDNSRVVLDYLSLSLSLQERGEEPQVLATV